MKPGLIVTAFAVFSVGVWILAFIGIASVATTIASPRGADAQRDESLLARGSGTEPIAHAEVPGLDQPGGFALTAYRQAPRDGHLVTVVEYAGLRPIAEVREFYAALFEQHGWTLTDESMLAGSSTYSIAAADRHGTVHIETSEGTTEVKIELSQPIESRGVTTDR